VLPATANRPNSWVEVGNIFGETQIFAILHSLDPKRTLAIWPMGNHCGQFQRPLPENVTDRTRPTAVTGENGKRSLAAHAEKQEAAARNAKVIFLFGRRQCSDSGHWP